MILGKKIIVVMPAYNAESTLRKTYEAIPHDVVDQVILVDDASHDGTLKLAREMDILSISHEKNMGYGANQKTCYRAAISAGADIVVMLHPDYQYEPRLITPIASMIASGVYDIVLGSRMITDGALQGGMPLYKYVANRFLTFVQNLMVSKKLSEYHTGYRAFSREVLLTLPLNENSNDFVFDNQMLAQAIFFGFHIGEISCPTLYEAESSSIPFKRSVRYGLGVLDTSTRFCLQKWNIAASPIFSEQGERITLEKQVNSPSEKPTSNEEGD